MIFSASGCHKLGKIFVYVDLHLVGLTKCMTLFLSLWELMLKHNHWWYFHWWCFFFTHPSCFLCAKKFVYDDRCARILEIWAVFSVTVDQAVTEFLSLVFSEKTHFCAIGDTTFCAFLFLLFVERKCILCGIGITAFLFHLDVSLVR